MKQYYPYIILALVIGIGSFFLLQQNRQIKGLKAQQEIINDALEDQKKDNIKVIDSLNKASKKQVIEVKLNTIDSLYKVFEANKTKPKYNTDIDKITDSDSINKLHAATYPQETIPEQKLEAVRNAQRVEVLKSDLSLAEVVITSQIDVIDALNDEVSRLDMIIALTNKNYKILETQYEALKAKGDSGYSFGDFLKDLGKVAIGIFIGVGAILIL